MDKTNDCRPNLAVTALDRALVEINKEPSGNYSCDCELIRDELLEVRQHVAGLSDKNEARDLLITLISSLRDLPKGKVDPPKTCIGGAGLGYPAFNHTPSGKPFMRMVHCHQSEKYQAFMSFQEKHAGPLSEAGDRLEAIVSLEKDQPLTEKSDLISSLCEKLNIARSTAGMRVNRATKTGKLVEIRPGFFRAENAERFISAQEPVRSRKREDPFDID